MGILGLSLAAKFLSVSKKNSAANNRSNLENKREFARSRLPKRHWTSNENRWSITARSLGKGAGKSRLGNTAPDANANGSQRDGLEKLQKSVGAVELEVRFLRDASTKRLYLTYGLGSLAFLAFVLAVISLVR